MTAAHEDQRPASPPNHARATRWVRAGWLIDGQGGPPRRNMGLALRAGRIVRIGPDCPEAAGGVDLSHATVLPALIDAHVHLVFSGSLDPQVRAAQLRHTPQQSQAAILRHLQEHRRCGVLAVRDGGDHRGDVRRFQQAHPGKADQPVHLCAACAAWYAAGRYGAMIGQSPPQGVSPAQAVAAHMEGGDHIKLIQSGLNSLDRFGHQGPAQFNAQELRAMVQAAHAAQRAVMVHANGEHAARTAIVAGCDSIEHGYFMGAENLRRMADRGTSWVPTAVPMAALTEAPGLSGKQQDVARRTLDHQLEQIRQAHTMGVNIVLGTDAGSQGVNHGHAVQQELCLLVNAGLGLAQAIGCATCSAAKLLRLPDRGALTPGRRADFIAVQGPPDNLPESLSEIEAICIGGTWESR